eukprot:TRINITY_DN4097_c0_g1_i4.p1 TRINITY_DN4097_c0_g1~~TRINITY_DN4097_c0_g1_i4.p1  ORF type:complete len:159 (+),score=0.92 TRINITY_DN4097_c0_g1_i4:252-728(+)
MYQAIFVDYSGVLIAVHQTAHAPQCILLRTCDMLSPAPGNTCIKHQSLRLRCIERRAFVARCDFDFGAQSRSSHALRSVSGTAACLLITPPLHANAARQASCLPCSRMFVVCRRRRQQQNKGALPWCFAMPTGGLSMPLLLLLFSEAENMLPSHTDKS